MLAKVSPRKPKEPSKKLQEVDLDLYITDSDYSDLDSDSDCMLVFIIVVINDRSCIFFFCWLDSPTKGKHYSRKTRENKRSFRNNYDTRYRSKRRGRCPTRQALYVLLISCVLSFIILFVG